MHCVEKNEDGLAFENGKKQFYGETMSVECLGFVRPEMKFNGLDELVTRIKTDVGFVQELADEDGNLRTTSTVVFVVTLYYFIKHVSKRLGTRIVRDGTIKTSFAGQVCLSCNLLRTRSSLLYNFYIILIPFTCTLFFLFF